MLTTRRTMSSREIAELTGKRHDNVMRDIEKMFADLGTDVSKFAHIYIDSANRRQTEYLLPERETMILVSGYDTVLRARVIDRWHQLESQKQLVPQKVRTLFERFHHNKNLYGRPGYWLMIELSHGDALSRLDDDEKGVATADTLGGPQEIAIINESGLYSLVLTSRKASAKRFKKWVTGEVLPAIRKTGGYVGTLANRRSVRAGCKPILSTSEAT